MKKFVSILIATKNQPQTIEDSIKSALKQNGFKTEVILLDDNSRNDVKKLYKKFSKKIRIIESNNSGRIPLINKGISIAKADFVCISAGDCILEKNFLKTIMPFFTSKKIAFVSPFSKTGGNCTVFQKKVLLEVNGFSTEYDDTKTGFRDDTDLAFRIWDKGYESIFNYIPKFKHKHKTPKSLNEKINYAISRLKLHSYDPLLFKNHPKRSIEFFDVKFGFLRNPLVDFKIATGLWNNKKIISLSSPQGVKLIENKNIINSIAIILCAAFYVIAVKTVRLYGSIKFNKLLL